MADTTAIPSTSTTLFFTQRTHFCGELAGKTNLPKEATLNGWVQVSRDLGGIIFIELRDRSGLMQLVADPQVNPEVHTVFTTLRSEDVIAIRGPITPRPEETFNKDHITGSIEIYPTHAEIISRSAVLPFQIEEETDKVDETVRLRHRYLDLRRPKMFQIQQRRHKITQCIRTYLNEHDFMELETPILIKATPEGARDFLVPSRVHPGHCYALPQSPQIFKQLLMVSGMERYYQIARCFRDEDLRADRQLEFTQLDVEMSFVSQDDVLALAEGLMQKVFSTVNIEISAPLPRITWHEAMEKYGSDKPDLRYGLEFTDLTEVFANSEFSAFRNPVKAGGVVKALRIEGASDYSRKELDDLQTDAKRYGAKGLAYIIYNDEGAKSPILKFLSDTEQQAIIERTGAKAGDIVFFMADAFVKACDVLGRFREHFARRHNLIDTNKHALLWVVDFPLFDVTDDGNLTPNHHPFTSPRPEDAHLLDSAPEKVIALGYDLVYNGNEIGGGSVRIHQEALQQKIFKTLGFSESEIQDKFGFLLEAFKYGTPPHAGIALGLDRLVALLCGAESIRDVIAFPKTNNAACPLTEAPSRPTDEQLKELHMKWALPKPKVKGPVTPVKS